MNQIQRLHTAPLLKTPGSSRGHQPQAELHLAEPREQVDLSPTHSTRSLPAVWRSAALALGLFLASSSGLLGPAAAATEQGWNATLARNFEQTQSQQVPHLSDLTSWKQGQHGNCSTIAFAKASNAVWGGRLYPQVEKDGQGGYRIQTQNQRTYSLSAGQLKAAVQMGDFRGPDNASKAQAIVTVGVLGQCYSETHQVSYQQALDKRANNGALASEFARCLGIPYWESTDPQKAVNHLSQAGQSQAGVLMALFKNGNNTEGHVEAIIPGPKGTVIGDSYGQPFVQSLKSPSVRIGTQDFTPWQATLLGQSWNELPPGALRDSVRGLASEYIVLQPAPGNLRDKAFLALSLLDGPESDLKPIEESLKYEREHGQEYGGWYARLAPRLSEATARRMFDAITLQMAYNNGFTPEQRTAAELLRSAGSSLSLQDQLQLSAWLVDAPANRPESLAAAVLEKAPLLSPQASSRLTREALSKISRWSQASPSQSELASGIYRDFQVPAEKQASYHQKLLQALATGSQQSASSIREAITGKR